MEAYQLEICAGSYESACAALKGGADRIELCAGLTEGGLTPSFGCLKAVLALDGIRKHVLIRPRSGDFLYTPEELDIMVEDIRLVREMGADGLAVGALTADGGIDLCALRRFKEAAGPLSVTFHRAFDVCANPVLALEQLVDAGCDRILTSGTAGSAVAGIAILRRLVKQAAGRISIMPACGVNPGNAAHILKETGAVEIHASARAIFPSGMAFRNPEAKMGLPGRDEYERQETSALQVRALVQALSGQIMTPPSPEK